MVNNKPKRQRKRDEENNFENIIPFSKKKKKFT